MHKMLSPLLLIAGLILPSASQQSPACNIEVTRFVRELEEFQSAQLELIVVLKEVAAAGVEVRAQLEQLQVDLTDLIQIVQVSQENVTRDLEILRGRQAVSGAVQGGQVFMFVAYLVTIAVLCLVKHCNKHRERLAQSEFELLEAKLQSNKAKRRAAAARAKSAPGPSPK